MLKLKKDSYYVADRYQNFRQLTIKTSKSEALEIANKLNETNFTDIMDFQGYRFCVLLADYRN